ncbi:MAG: MBL fold metallo-hydrolase [Chloroflexi bacterium]|nr:MBL fold metallo-hydrolase [Chloroflexota bacterium]
MLDITYYGGSCFRITERGPPSVLTDPHLPAERLAALKLRANLITLSHAADAQQLAHIRECQYTIAGAGEYEVGQLFVTGFPLHRYAEADASILHNVAYIIEYPNGLTLLHLGALNAPPDLAIAEQLDEVHALMLPIGGETLSSDQMADLISAIEPSFVLPMRHARLLAAEYPAALEGFLKAMGAGEVTEQDNLRLSATSLPETTQIVLLRANQPKS